VNATTASRATRVLGTTALVGVAVLLLFAFVISPEDVRTEPVTGQEVGQRDAVRLMYVHVPLAVLSYVFLTLCAVGSAIVLWRRSRWWDHVAYAAGEIGTLFCGLTLLTGMIWGRPTWGTWWEWGDVRLVTTLVLFLLFVGYLALRRIPGDPDVVARRAAVVALLGVLMIPVVNRSVEWWENRTLHQKSTLAELRIQDMTLFTLMLGFVVLGLVGAWLLIHRFRVAWLEGELDRAGLDTALAERRAEALVGVEAAVARPRATIPEVATDEEGAP
jgi:heme exporter protein C